MNRKCDLEMFSNHTTRISNRQWPTDNSTDSDVWLFPLQFCDTNLSNATLTLGIANA